MEVSAGTVGGRRGGSCGGPNLENTVVSVVDSNLEQRAEGLENLVSVDRIGVGEH